MLQGQPTTPAKVRKPASADEKPVISLPALARAALERNDNCIRMATSYLTKALMDDEDLLERVLLEVVSLASSELVSNSIYAQRRAIQSGISRPNINGKIATQAMAENTVRSIMDWPIADGLRLRDATRDQIEKQRDIHAEIARTNASKANWFAMIADAMPDEGTVGEHLTEDRVLAFFEASKR